MFIQPAIGQNNEHVTRTRLLAYWAAKSFSEIASGQSHLGTTINSDCQIVSLSVRNSFSSFERYWGHVYMSNHNHLIFIATSGLITPDNPTSATVSGSVIRIRKVTDDHSAISRRGMNELEILFFIVVVRYGYTDM